MTRIGKSANADAVVVAGQKWECGDCRNRCLKSGGRPSDHLVANYDDARYEASERHSRFQRELGTLGLMGIERGAHEKADAVAGSLRENPRPARPLDE